MRPLSDSLFNLSIYFTFPLFIAFSFQHFLQASRQQSCALALRNWVSSTTRIPPQEMTQRLLLTETYVEFSQESVTKQRFFEDLDYDDPLSVWCFSTHTEDEPITWNEKACRPVCRRHWVGIELGNPLSTVTQVTPQGHEVQRENSESEQIRTLGPTKVANPRWLLSGDSKTRIPGSLWPRKYTQIEWNDRAAARRPSLRSSWRTPSTRSTTSSWTVIAAKFGITWSSSKKSRWNGRIQEIWEFCIRYYGKTKTSRGSEHYLGTLRQSTGIAERN